MIGPNLNYIFYKKYYENVGNDDRNTAVIRKCNSILMNAKFQEEGNSLDEKLFNKSFDLCVKYPGLLIGMGMIHGTGKSEEEIKAGITLDYVTGMPYIPAPSVKGILRGAFRGVKAVYVEEKLGVESAGVKELETKIFGDEAESSGGKGDDIFWDAQIISGNAQGKMLGRDNITPHKSIIRDPEPVNTIKILPNVKLRFYFSLSDTVLVDGTVINADQKTSLFKNILMDFGAGAKTNTGYGILSENVQVRDGKRKSDF